MAQTLLDQLLDQMNGSMQHVNQALALTEFCYNLSLLTPPERCKVLRKMQLDTGMSDADLAEVRRDWIDPMVQHCEDALLRGEFRGRLPEAVVYLPEMDHPADDHDRKLTTTDRYSPCPCNSGKKYKFCCGRSAVKAR